MRAFPLADVVSPAFEPPCNAFSLLTCILGHSVPPLCPPTAVWDVGLLSCGPHPTVAASVLDYSYLFGSLPVTSLRCIWTVPRHRRCLHKCLLNEQWSPHMWIHYVRPPFDPYRACTVNRFYSLSIHQRFLISSCFSHFGYWGNEAKLSYLVFIFHGQFGSTFKSCGPEAWGGREVTGRSGNQWPGSVAPHPTPPCWGWCWMIARGGVVMLCLWPLVCWMADSFHPPTHPSIHPYYPPDCLNHQRVASEPTFLLLIFFFLLLNYCQ